MATAYDKLFPYVLSYKGSTYTIDRVLGTGSVYYTTIQKDSNPAVTFNDTSTDTPAYINFTIGDGSSGAVGNPVEQATLNIDTLSSAIMMLQEGETEWGKQLLQDLVHIIELVDTLSIQLNPIYNPVQWTLFV